MKERPKIPASLNRIYSDVEFLCELKPARTYQNLQSLNEAADFIKSVFESTELAPEEQTFSVYDDTYRNILASYQPEKEERIVVGAHYDVCGEQPGADDNASAVAGLLEVARLFQELKPKLPYRVDFVAFTLEEPPFFSTPYMGSAVHARSLKESKVKVKAMICLEMIGYFSEEPNSQKFPVPALKALYPSKGNFIVVVSNLSNRTLNRHMKKYMKKGSEVGVYSIEAPNLITGIDFSDHRNYWAEGYPAVMINDTSFYRNPHYHQASDTIDTLDFEKLTEVVKGVYWALAHFK